MVTRRGTLLEKNVEKIFKIMGFETKRNYFINGYEIDVYATLGHFSVAVQCKQYEQSTLNIRDVIHQWDSKNKKINADKIILMIYGQDIEERHVELGKELDITVLGEPELDLLENLIIKDDDFSKNKVLKILGINKSFGKIAEEAEQSKSKVGKIFLSFFLMMMSLILLSVSSYAVILFFGGLIWLIYILTKK